MNVLELRNQMIEIFSDLQNKKLSKSEANSLANVSGKILKSASLELDYKKYTGNKNKIHFLEV